MTSPGELVSMMSAVLGIPEATVYIYARHLREAGLISKGGRGRSAAKMTPLDASRLLLAFLSTETAALAAQAVIDFGSLKCTNSKLNGDPDLTLEALFGKKLPPPISFENTLAALISGFSDHEFIRVVEKSSWGSPQHPLLPLMSACVYESKLGAEINIHNNKYSFSFLSASKKPTKHDAAEFEKFHDRWFKGLRVTREITVLEICRIGDFLRT